MELTAKSLVGTRWQHREQLYTLVVKEQFIVGEDIEPWVDCRDDANVCYMLRAQDLAVYYTKVGSQ